MTTRNRETLLIIIRTIEALYVWFMYTQFKTRWSIHHPLENYFIGSKKQNIYQWLSHPISSKRYESKICPLGHLVGWILPFVIIGYTLILIYSGNSNWKNTLTKGYILLWIIIFIVSLILNLNAWIYLFPAFILEFLIFFFHN